MQEPKMRARVSLLHKTEAEWEILDSTQSIKPFAGELIIYDPDDKFDYARLKIGDGHTLLKDLPFFIDSSIKDYLQNLSYEEAIDGGRIK
jgi:hypothetical protein